MPELTLIQLISEQTMPNFLPVLRLKPAKLVHLVTPKTAPRSAHIAEASRGTGQTPTLETVNLSAMPKIPETCHAVKTAVRAEQQHGRRVIVNFTGGTKLMSIGAYAAARDSKTPSLYVDPDDELFVSGETGEGLADLLEKDYSFTSLRKALTVDVVAVANGRQRVTAGLDWKPMLPLAQHFLTHPAEEQKVHEAMAGPAGLLPAGREPRKPQEWLHVVGKSFALPPAVVPLAANAGLVEVDATGACRLPAFLAGPIQELTKRYDTHKWFQAVGAIHRITGFLLGGWLEVSVMDAAKRSGRFRDLRWSVNVGERDGADLEEDIVGIEGVQILYISCKRGGQRARLLPLLDEMNARARAIGGHFSRRVLVTLQPPAGYAANALPQRARELGITLFTGEDLRAGRAFQKHSQSP